MESASNLVLPKENNTEFFEVNELDSSINEGSHTIFLRIIPEKDPNNNVALNPHEKSEIPLDPTLDYIRRYLLEEEEDVDGENIGYQEAALSNMEKPFYDILGEKYPPSQDNQLLSCQSKENPNFTTNISKQQGCPTFDESSKQHLSIEDLLATEFHRGVEEGKKFLPNPKKLPIDLQVSKLQLDPMRNCDSNFRLKEEKESGLQERSKGKKSSHDADLDLSEGRDRKILLRSCEETIRDEMFDEILLNHDENFTREEISSIKKFTELKIRSCCSKDPYPDEYINLRDLLISCAEAVSINDNEMASVLIKKIRKHVSPIGDGTQRLGCVLADGLELRLSGTKSATYRQSVAKRLSSKDILKMYKYCLRASPLLRVAYHFANESILNAVGTASKIHIIDFGIIFGFQWPSLIQALAKMKNGPRRLRITGVDFPQPGFHPAERSKVTGKRLEDYARDFGVSFEYHGVASQWESISIKDLNIRDDEVLIVNSIYTFSGLRVEPLLGMNKSRDNILNLIQKIKPNVFLQGIHNFSFSPYFVPRFRMVLLHYSRFFDMLDTLVPRNSKPRQQLETELLGPSIINQIACEGLDLVWRPETYKQCHMRNLKNSFEPVKVDPKILKECSEIVRKGYDKRFFTEEDCNWFLQGWKGSIMYAVSLWKPRV